MGIGQSANLHPCIGPIGQCTPLMPHRFLMRPPAFHPVDHAMRETAIDLLHALEDDVDFDFESLGPRAASALLRLQELRDLYLSDEETTTT